MQGDLWRVASRGALGGGLLVLPMLFVARPQRLVSLGPFADAWWVGLVLATVGLAFSMDALATAARILRRTARALEQGYDLHTVAQVLADLRHDMGFLVQGARHFSVTSESERRSLATIRVVVVGCHALAGVWLPIALALSLFAAARGWIDPTALWVITLVPALVLYVVGGLAGVLEDHKVSMARRAWFGRPWAADLVREEIETWRRGMAHEEGRTSAEPDGAARSAALRRLAVAFGVLAVLAALPVLTLIPTSAIGPVLANVTIPRFSSVQERAARIEAYVDERVPVDTTLSPQEAGRLLQDVLYVGSDRTPPTGERAPEQRIERPWLPDVMGAEPVGLAPVRWAEGLFPRVRDHLPPSALAYLDSVADEPAQALFSRLAEARSVDVAAGRWADPFPEATTLASLPIPRLGALREAAYAHLGAAAADLAHGRADAAERKIREVISVGFLLADDGPTLIDNLIGDVIVSTGGTALESFYRAAGRTADAGALAALAAAADRSASRMRALSSGRSGLEEYLGSLPAMVLDTSAVRGLRWEYLRLTATLTPCLNLNRMVFGPDSAYEAFLRNARASLVRYPSEDGLFDLAVTGYFVPPSATGHALLGRFLTVSMRSGEGTCSAALSGFHGLRGKM
jgi:hypothetical protein